MNDFQKVKLEIFIPTEYLKELRQALAEAGAGKIGNYDKCCAVMAVCGYWRPLPGANPFLGEIGSEETSVESKLEVTCEREIVMDTIRAIRSIHPYEEPVINIIPLANHLFTD